MSWELDTGFKDDYIFRVDSATFENLEDMGGQCCLVLTGSDLEDPDLTPSIRYTCGTAWEATPSGAEAVHFKGKDRFNARSKMGLLVGRTVEILGVDQASKLGDPTKASTWVNIVLHIVDETRSYSFKNSEGEQQEGTTTDHLPTEIWRSEKEWSDKGGQTISNPATVSPTSKVEQAKARLANKSINTTHTQLLALAQLHDQATFIEKALEIDDVVADDELVAQVVDESASGFWAKYQK